MFSNLSSFSSQLSLHLISEPFGASTYLTPRNHVDCASVMYSLSIPKLRSGAALDFCISVPRRLAADCVPPPRITAGSGDERGARHGRGSLLKDLGPQAGRWFIDCLTGPCTATGGGRQ